MKSEKYDAQKLDYPFIYETICSYYREEKAS